MTNKVPRTNKSLKKYIILQIIKHAESDIPVSLHLVIMKNENVIINKLKDK